MENKKMKVVHSSSGGNKKETSKEEKQLYDVLVKLPAPKKEMNLSKDQRKLWYWIGKEFLTTNQICLLDLYHLQTLVMAVDKRNKMYRIINDKNELDFSKMAGSVQTFATGARQISPEEVMVKNYTSEINEVSKLFGFSLKDRQKLTAAPTDSNQLDLFGMIAEQLTQAQ